MQLFPLSSFSTTPTALISLYTNWFPIKLICVYNLQQMAFNAADKSGNHKRFWKAINHSSSVFFVRMARLLAIPTDRIPGVTRKNPLRKIADSISEIRRVP